MRIDVADLVRVMRGNGDGCEAFVHDLVRSVCRFHGIDPTGVLRWDYRTYVRDGGRDLILSVGSPTPSETFLPSAPSIWSIKSGEDGVSPSALKKEIREHPKVRKALEEGRKYVWCAIHPASHDKHDEMRLAADEIAEELKFDRSLIEFRGPEDLQGKVNLHPGLIPVHFRDVALLLNDVMTFAQWEREPGMRESWVDFGGRAEVADIVANHLFGRHRPNVLHIAGLSGIGKTRTVFEAFRRQTELQAVFYIQRFEHLSRELYRYLENEDRNVFLVVDETPLDQVPGLISRLGDFAERIRVVTLGPAVRQAAVTRDEIRILPEPDTEEGVLAVVRSAGRALAEPVQRSIALQSGHDLRLALLLVEASLRLDEFRGVPVVNIDGVWSRLMALFEQEIGDRHSFRQVYEVLTPSIDVGMDGEFGVEVEALATHFQHPVEHVRDVANRSARCGLGIRTRHFFEAAPRALAARVFAERVWPRVRDRLEPFFQALPERLQRRFLQRCYDCTGNVREEVMARLADFFLARLAHGDITALAAREASRIFQTWAEFDPIRGLGWLRRAVDEANPQQLRSIDGDPDGSGGWRGRRQLVWLCQNLASFAEHFRDCEAILYRLALAETEPSIGNNSTIVWQSMFWPVLTGTSVPFSDRLPILISRLERAGEDSLPVVLGAAIGCVDPRTIGLPLPERIVGGRIAPSPWRPQTMGEVVAMRRQAGDQILQAIEKLAVPMRHRAVAVLMEHITTFAGLGLLAPLRAVLQKDRLDDSLRRRLRGHLEHHIAFIQEINRQDNGHRDVTPLQLWLAELLPTDLANRVRDVTAQDPWSVWEPEQSATRYDALADELIAARETLLSLAEWFSSPEARSANVLAERIALRDRQNQLAAPMRQWLTENRAPMFTLSYLVGVATREAGLPSEWATLLDNLAATHPALVAQATTASDFSGRGITRLLNVLNRLPAPASRFLRPLAFGSWLRVASEEQRHALLQALNRLAESGDDQAAHVGLDLIQMWSHQDAKVVDERLAGVGLDLARRAVFSGGRREYRPWLQVLRLLTRHYPREASELLVREITRVGGPAGWADQEPVEILVEAAAVSAPAVMEAVGAAILDPARSPVFGIAVFHGLFEAIGVETVRTWLDRHGAEHLRWMTRHFQSPYVDETGTVFVPPLTEWLFREREDDQRAFEWFLMGRQSGRGITAADVDPVQRRAEMEPFLNHELRRVREWAAYEVETTEQHAQWFRDMDEEDERR
jgi:hypothetical protein